MISNDVGGAYLESVCSLSLLKAQSYIYRREVQLAKNFKPYNIRTRCRILCMVVMDLFYTFMDFNPSFLSNLNQ